MTSRTTGSTFGAPAATASPAARSRHPRYTTTPSRRASASTTALPMPRVPPVTNILDGGSQSRRWTCAALAARRPSGSG